MKNSKYQSAVKQLLQASSTEAVTHNRQVRDEVTMTPEQILEQKLVSFRLALKMGNARTLDHTELVIKHIKEPLLIAEACFVRGMVLIHKVFLEEAALSFEQAAENYLRCENIEKSLLCRFNALIARANGKLISVQQELQACNEILAMAMEKGQTKIQALCLRQKSYSYYSSDRSTAAYQEIITALPLIELHCPVSDYHLALIHAAECAIDSKQIDQAKVHLDYLPQQVDSRVDFPKAYVMAKLKGTTLDIEQFSDINPHWKGRYESYLANQTVSVASKSKIFWNSKSSLMTTEKKQILGRIKVNSLEGLFLKMLMRGPQTKELLSEVLWPEFASTENLDDRFFRLKNRLSQKMGSMIVFDGQFYSLSVEIKWV